MGVDYDLFERKYIIKTKKQIVVFTHINALLCEVLKLLC